MQKFLFGENNDFMNYFTYAYSLKVKSFKKFVIEKDHIINSKAYDSAKTTFDYVSIISKKKYKNKVNVETVCSFENFGAPLIVLAENKINDNGKIFYGKHFEIVVYGEGLNVWEILPTENELDPYKVNLLASKKFIVNKNEKINLKVTIHGDALHVKVGDNELDMKSNFPLEMYIGLQLVKALINFIVWK